MQSCPPELAETLNKNNVVNFLKSHDANRRVGGLVDQKPVVLYLGSTSAMQLTATAASTGGPVQPEEKLLGHRDLCQSCFQ